MGGVRHLFVYGTLRRGSAVPLARELAARAAYCGAATVCGRLYSLGPYPGILLGGGVADRVAGDVYELPMEPDLLARLDAYEGCARHSPQPHEFGRVRAPARLGDRPIDVWVYELVRPADSAQRIVEWPCDGA